MAARPTSPSKPSQRAALDILRGRSRRRRREPTAAELANERRVFDEVADLMEAGVLVDRSEVVPPLPEESKAGPIPQAPFTEQLSFDHVEWQACTNCFWNWQRSCEREGCWLAEFERTAK